jgi:hypothetical protein
MVKGALHLHSTYSDGEFTLPQLRELFLAEGCTFACMADHAEYFNQQSVLGYISECESLSDRAFQFVAGLEYRCEQGMHILGYGATKLNQSIDPQDVIHQIDSQGAVSVIAHPRDDCFALIESFERLPRGIETWNTKYDGRYAPRPGTFALLRRLQKRQPAMFAFFGQDLHWKHQFRGLFVDVDCAPVTGKTILAALASGNYCATKDSYRLPASGLVSDQLLAHFARAHDRSYRLWLLLKRAKLRLEACGIKVPDSLKANLRRIF